MDYTFTVMRTRQSVTQGNATVFLNGEALVTYDDPPKLIKAGQKYYGENIGGYASVISDGDFIYSVLFYSGKVRKLLKWEDKE